MRLLKIGGNELDAPGFMTSLAKTVAGLVKAGEKVVVVHGGGRDIASLQSRLGIVPVKLNGLRVTDEETLAVAEMVLSGQANKRLVRALLGEGVEAIGLSGVDGGILRCQKKHHPTGELGWVGEITGVRVDLLSRLLDVGTTVVLSPISLGPDSQPYNVNADEAASAVAEAIGAEALDFVSNVPGVLSGDAPLPCLDVAEAEALIQKGVITGGMLPKVRAALAAVGRGVPVARIVDLAGLASGGGTRFLAHAAA